MLRFLHEFREERTDLEPNVDYLDSFLQLRKHIRREDLPRHVQRFKERLNEKVIQEIGLLNGAFQTERNEITSKIGLLNRSLQKLEYRPGTHMRLDPRQVRDVEIAEFQDSLKACLAGTFEGTMEADEARFLQVEKLINRLREDQRWRDKVTDVRRWFEFAAREIDTATGEQRSYFEDSTGQSGGEKAKLAFTILVAAIAYQYDIDPCFNSRCTRTSATLLSHQAVTSLRWSRLRKARPLSKFCVNRSDRNRQPLSRGKLEVSGNRCDRICVLEAVSPLADCGQAAAETRWRRAPSGF